MKTGDIILTYHPPDKHAREVQGRSLIQLGQNLNYWLAGGSDSTPLTHAAIAVNDTQVVEASADGIVLSNLSEESNPRDAVVLRLRCFQPYFPNGTAVAYTLTALAGTQAMSYCMQGDNSKLDASFRAPNAIAAMIAGTGDGPLHRRLQQYSNYGDHSFAAGLVVNCYEIAMRLLTCKAYGWTISHPHQSFVRPLVRLRQPIYGAFALHWASI